MATTNGDQVTHSSRSISPTAGNLGKRKRSESPDVLQEDGDTITLSAGGPVQRTIEGLLKSLRQYDSSPSLLTYPLPPKSLEPNTKRPRLTKADDDFDNIENRVKSGLYKSAEEMVADVDRAASALLEGEQGLSEQVNGELRPRSGIDGKTKEQIAKIRGILAKQPQQEIDVTSVIHEKRTTEATEVELGNDDHLEQGQVLTLRGSTEKLPRQLYSGLQIPILKPSTDGNDAASIPTLVVIDGRLLPNGFDLAGPTIVDSDGKRDSSHDSRTFGEVFRPPSNLKPLEQPRPGWSSAKGSRIGFVSSDDRIFEAVTPKFKSDYKFSPLPTGQWMRYGDGGDDRPTDEKAMKSLFRASYSSFAPTHDNSMAVVSDVARGEFWWKNAGHRRYDALFASRVSEREHRPEITQCMNPSTDEFADVIAALDQGQELISIDGQPTEDSEISDVDSVLEEVSNLLQTLYSYQQMRNLASPKPSYDASSPTTAEFDTYEILKSQLVILIRNLPPFAVAKLSGDQLKELEISTKIVTEVDDFAGVSEADEFTLEKRKAAQAAATAAARTSFTNALPPKQNSYQTPAAAAAATASYNARARSHNPGVATPGVPVYGSGNTPAAAYQTPRLPVQPQRSNYTQPGYQQPQTTNTPYTPQPHPQQFQRTVQNGYTTYTPTTASQPNYGQRPIPAQYQSGPVINPRSMSPQKPITNGQSAQPRMQYSSQPGPQMPYQGVRPQPPPQGTSSYSVDPARQFANTEQRTAMERLKAQQQAQYQASQGVGLGGMRQDSATPHPPTPTAGPGAAGSDGGSGYVRYDGVVERSASKSATPSLEPRQIFGSHQ